ncbi:conserved membrane hypothetical protein [Verrucomicrobia bacterium]|nr:conserved membrane hypothetical protein [Verrucomicrobiota bacterium]
MALVNFILNLVGLLLWTSWRSWQFDPLLKSSPATLAGTLKRAEPRRVKGWHVLSALAVLLFLRAVLYRQVGSAVNWTPHLQLGAIVLAFRSDFFGRMLLFSVCSFGSVLAVFYLWLLLLSLVIGRVSEPSPWPRLVRLHLGPLGQLPPPLKIILPLLGGLVLWLPLSFLLVRSQIIPAARSWPHRLEQAVVIGLGAYLCWQYLVGLLLALHILNSYLYFGSHSFWTFISLTARRLLYPLRWIPLRLGKIDFAPLVAIALAFAAAQFAERGLTLLYQRLPL